MAIKDRDRGRQQKETDRQTDVAIKDRDRGAERNRQTDRCGHKRQRQRGRKTETEMGRKKQTDRQMWP